MKNQQQCFSCKTDKIDGNYEKLPSDVLYIVICEICRFVCGEETNKYRHFAVSV